MSATLGCVRSVGGVFHTSAEAFNSKTKKLHGFMAPQQPFITQQRVVLRGHCQAVSSWCKHHRFPAPTWTYRLGPGAASWYNQETPCTEVCGAAAGGARRTVLQQYVFISTRDTQ